MCNGLHRSIFSFYSILRVYFYHVSVNFHMFNFELCVRKSNLFHFSSLSYFHQIAQTGCFSSSGSSKTSGPIFSFFINQLRIQQWSVAWEKKGDWNKRKLLPIVSRGLDNKAAQPWWNIRCTLVFSLAESFLCIPLSFINLYTNNFCSSSRVVDFPIN